MDDKPDDKSGDKPSYEELEQYVKRLEHTVFKKIRAEAVNKALFHIASAQNTSETLQDFYRSIHRHLSALRDMTNFYIGLYYKKEKCHSLTSTRGYEKDEPYFPEGIPGFSDNPFPETENVAFGKKSPLFLG